MAAVLVVVASGVLVAYAGAVLSGEPTKQEVPLQLDNSNFDKEVVSCCAFYPGARVFEGEIKVTSSMDRRGKYVIDLVILDADCEGLGKTRLVLGEVAVDAVIRGRFSAKVVRPDDAKTLRVDNVERL